MSQDPAPGPPEPSAAETAPTETPIPLTFGPTVTLFFSDIRGFTEYTDAHGDAAAYRMLHYHNTMVQEQIALYGGHIVKTLGDSYMVSFDAARNAMACGIGVQKSLALYNSDREGARINIGIGINTGEPIRDAEDYFGGSVNLAARICAAAGAGQILVSDAVRHVVGKMEGTDYVDRGHFDLKGFQEPQHLYEVDWSGLAATTPSPPPRTTPSVPPPTPVPADQAAVPGARPTRGRRRLLVGAAILALLGLLGGVFLVLRSQEVPPLVGATAARPQAGPSAAPAEPAVSGEQLLRADDFSDPAHALFSNNQQGTGRLVVAGAPTDYQWSYIYQGGAMVGRVVGVPPQAAVSRYRSFARSRRSTRSSGTSPSRSERVPRCRRSTPDPASSTSRLRTKRSTSASTRRCRVTPWDASTVSRHRSWASAARRPRNRPTKRTCCAWRSEGIRRAST